MFTKFITKENILIAVFAFYIVIQSGYFATKLDVSTLRNEMLNMKLELQQYSDTHDKEILKEIDNKYDKIMMKLDKLQKIEVIMFKGIILHWTAGNYTPNKSDLLHYHYLFNGQGKMYLGEYTPHDNENCTDGKYAAHTGGGNTGRIGLAICCRRDLKTLPTQKQVEAMCKKAAECCITYGISVDKVQTHAEFGVANPTTTSKGKIDINSIPYANKSGIKECGDYLRNKVNWYYKKIKEDYLL